MFEDARSDNGRLEELRAAVRVLHGRAHGDASAANVFLQQLQQQQQCVWLCSEGLREGYDPLVGFAMASMLRHALLRFIAEYTDEDKHKLFARVMHILATSDDNSALVMQLCLCVGAIVSQIEQSPCHWLMNTNEYTLLPVTAKLQLMSTLPGCGLWLTGQEVLACLAHVLELGQRPAPSLAHMAALMSCLLAWVELPMEPEAEVSLYTAFERLPQMLTLSENIICLCTPFVTRAVLAEMDPEPGSDASAALIILFGAMDILCALMSCEAQEQSLLPVTLSYLARLVEGLKLVVSLSIRPTPPNPDILARKVAMVAAEILRHTSYHVSKGLWAEGSDLLLQLLLDLLTSQDLAVVELVLIEDAWEPIIEEGVQIRTRSEDGDDRTMEAVLDTLVHNVIARCMYPLDWESWESCTTIEETDFNKFRLNHARSMLLTITSKGKDRIARLLLSCLERSSNWVEAEVSLFGFYCVGSELHSTEGSQVEEALWRLAQCAMTCLTDDSTPPPVRAAALQALGETTGFLHRHPGLLLPAFEAALSDTAHIDKGTCDAAAVALASMSFQGKTLLCTPQICEQCVLHADRASPSLSREGRCRMFEGLMRVCTAGLNRLDSLQAAFALLDLCLHRLRHVTMLLTEGRVSVSVSADPLSPLSPLGSPLSPSRTHAYPLSPLRKIRLTTEVCQQLRDEADVLYCVTKVITPQLHPPVRVPSGRERAYVTPHEQTTAYAAEFVTTLWEACGTLVAILDTVARTEGPGDKMDLTIDCVCLLIRSLVEAFREHSRAVWPSVADGLVHIFLCSDCSSSAPIVTAVSFATQATSGREGDPQSSAPLLGSMMAAFKAGLKRLAARDDARTSPVFGSFLCLCTVLVTFVPDIFLSMSSFPEMVSLAAYLVPSHVEQTSSQSVELLSQLLFKMRKGIARDQELLSQVVQPIAPDLIFYILVGVSEGTPVAIVPRVASVLAPLLHQPSMRPHLALWLHSALSCVELQRLSTAIRHAGSTVDAFIGSIMAIEDPYNCSSSTKLDCIDEVRQILLQSLTLCRGATTALGTGQRHNTLAQHAMSEAYG